MNDDETHDWIFNLIPEEEVEQLESKANRIVEAHGTFYEMSVMMSQEDMIQAVRASYLMRRGDTPSWMLGIGILMSLIGTMEDALKQDGIPIWE